MSEANMKLTDVARMNMDLSVRSAEERHGRIHMEAQRITAVIKGQHEEVDALLQADLAALAECLGMEVPDGSRLAPRGDSLEVVPPAPPPAGGEKP